MIDLIFLTLNAFVVGGRLYSGTWWWINWLNLLAVIIAFESIRKRLARTN